MKTDWFDFWASIVPSKTAITTDDEKSYDFQKINERGQKIASYFHSKGVQKGDRAWR